MPVSLIDPASRSRVRVSQVVETNRGTTPADPSWKVVPQLEATAFEEQKTYERSAEIKSNRMGGRQVGGTKMANGNLAVPLKNDPAIRELIESAFSTALSLPTLSGSDLAYADNGGSVIDITDSQSRFRTAGFVAGMKVTTADSTTAGNDATYTIASVAADGSKITLTSAADTAEAFTGSTSITAASGNLFGKAGVTRKFFSHEVAYLDLDPVVYEYFRGMEVNDLSIEVPTSGEVTAEFDMIGVDSESTTTQFTLGTGSYASVADVVPFAGSIDGAALERDGTTNRDVESMSISISNNREAKFAIGDETASHIDQGDWDAEIQAQIYFTSLDLRQKYLAGTRFSLVVTLIDQKDGHKMVIEFPNVVITASPKGTSGQSVTEQVTFFAEEDATHGSKALVWFLSGS